MHLGVYEAGGEPYETVEIQGNLLLNEGIQLLEDLMIGAGGTSWDNANARLGVGDSNAAEAATQTDLQGTNKTYKAMEATYPQRSGQTLTWRSVFAECRRQSRLGRGQPLQRGRRHRRESEPQGAGSGDQGHRHLDPGTADHL